MNKKTIITIVFLIAFLIFFVFFIGWSFGKLQCECICLEAKTVGGTTNEQTLDRGNQEDIENVVDASPVLAKQLYLTTVPEIIYEAVITAYTSSPEETDGNPCMSASGNDICNIGFNNIVACPSRYEFWTMIELPDGSQFVCLDRVSLKYPDRFDIYMGQGLEAKQEAFEWGIKKMSIKILK